jgi:hypothetical protein
LALVFNDRGHSEICFALLPTLRHFYILPNPNGPVILHHSD